MLLLVSFDFSCSQHLQCRFAMYMLQTLYHVNEFCFCSLAGGQNIRSRNNKSVVCPEKRSNNRLASQGSLFSKLLQFFLSTAIITMLQYYSCFSSIFKRLWLPPRPTVFGKNINTPQFSFKLVSNLIGYIFVNSKCSIFKLQCML